MRARRIISRAALVLVSLALAVEVAAPLLYRWTRKHPQRTRGWACRDLYE